MKYQFYPLLNGAVLLRTNNPGECLEIVELLKSCPFMPDSTHFQIAQSNNPGIPYFKAEKWMEIPFVETMKARSN